MDEKKDSRVNQVSYKIQLMNEEIKNELKHNPCILDKEAFVDALANHVTKFINEHYRD